MIDMFKIANIRQNSKEVAGLSNEYFGFVGVKNYNLHIHPAFLNV